MVFFVSYQMYEWAVDTGWITGDYLYYRDQGLRPVERDLFFQGLYFLFYNKKTWEFM